MSAMVWLLNRTRKSFSGHLDAARTLTTLAARGVQADKTENAATWEAIEAQREAAFGNAQQAVQVAAKALKMDQGSRSVEGQVALAFALAGDRRHADFLAQDLSERFPRDTQVQTLWLPTIRGQIALDQKEPSLALSILQAASIDELGNIPSVVNISCLYKPYVRGEAYLAAGKGGAAASEFQRILDHNGIVWNCWTGALARLGLARALGLEFKAVQGTERDQARVKVARAYENVLALWKDADPNLPVLKEAKAEYAKLH